MQQLETRSQVGSSFRLNGQEGRTVNGTAIVYNSLSQDLGGFVERFAPGSVTDSINGGQLTAVLDHDDNKHLASQAANSLRAYEDTQGVHFEFQMPDTSYARDFLALNNDKRQEHRGVSFSFRTAKGGTTWAKEDGQNVRTITKATLGHISPVIDPAYRATSFNVRSLGGDPEVIDYAEQYGLDLDRLAKVFVALKRGMPLSADEMELARVAYRHLRPLIERPKLDAAEMRAGGILL